MRVVSFYHKETGKLHSNKLMASDDSMVDMNTPIDHVAIDGHHDHLSNRVDVTTGEIKEQL